MRRIRTTLDSMLRAGELRAIRVRSSAGGRNLGTLLLLLSLAGPGLYGQVRTQGERPAPQVFLTIGCENSAVDLVLSDPLNRRLGNDPPHHQAYDEIPGAYTDGAAKNEETGAREEDPGEVMNIVTPQPGRYTLTLIGAGDGTYSCWISASLENGARAQISLRRRPLRRDEVEQVQFSFDPKSSSFLLPLDSAVTGP